MVHPRQLCHLLLIFPLSMEEKTENLSGIRTRIIRVYGKHADHSHVPILWRKLIAKFFLTTTAWECRALFSNNFDKIWSVFVFLIDPMGRLSVD